MYRKQLITTIKNERTQQTLTVYKSYDLDDNAYYSVYINNVLVYNNYSADDIIQCMAEQINKDKNVN